jgi:hypothetical protein
MMRVVAMRMWQCDVDNARVDNAMSTMRVVGYAPGRAAGDGGGDSGTEGTIEDKVENVVRVV